MLEQAPAGTLNQVQHLLETLLTAPEIGVWHRFARSGGLVEQQLQPGLAVARRGTLEVMEVVGIHSQYVVEVMKVVGLNLSGYLMLQLIATALRGGNRPWIGMIAYVVGAGSGRVNFNIIR